MIMLFGSILGFGIRFAFSYLVAYLIIKIFTVPLWPVCGVIFLILSAHYAYRIVVKNQ